MAQVRLITNQMVTAAHQGNAVQGKRGCFIFKRLWKIFT